MLKWANEQTLHLASFSSMAFLQSGDSLADWLQDMKSDYTPGDKLALYCLSKMYLRHVHVDTKKPYWTTVQHAWGDSEKTIRDKCELSLIYMGPGKFAEMIPLVVNSDEQTAQRTNVTSTNTNVSATRAKSVSTENSTKDTCCENTSKNKRTKINECVY